MPTLQEDIARLALQEERLRFETLAPDLAWQIGSRLKSLAEAKQSAVTIEIRINHETVFFYAMPGTAPENADWARRKRNVVDLLHKSSYRVGRELERDGASLEARMGLPTRDYATHGGSFPLMVAGIGCVGSVTVSGLPQRVDHAMLVEVLAALCGIELDEVALN